MATTDFYLLFLGAALAFNNIYGDIRKYEMIRKIYWMELFVHFIRNMSSSYKNDCNNVEAAVALDNLTKTICENFSEFNVVSGVGNLAEFFYEKVSQYSFPNLKTDLGRRIFMFKTDGY